MTRGEIRYPISDVEPSSPRVVLSEKHAKAWQHRVQLTRASPISVNSVSLQQRQDDDQDEGKESEVPDLPEPPLEWYADQLAVVCGRALTPTSERLLALQVRHASGLGLLDEGEQLWPLLLEAATLFAAAAYHVQRAAEVLTREVGGLIVRRGSGQGVAGAARVPDSSIGLDSGSQRRLPMPPFTPKGANAALADLHLYVAKLQTTGPQLASTLHRLVQGMTTDPVDDVQRLLDMSPIRGNKGAFGNHSFGASAEEDSQGRLQTLFMTVPCIEEAMERLGTLMFLS